MITILHYNITYQRDSLRDMSSVHVIGSAARSLYGAQDQHWKITRSTAGLFDGNRIHIYRTITHRTHVPHTHKLARMYVCTNTARLTKYIMRMRQIEFRAPTEKI